MVSAMKSVLALAIIASVACSAFALQCYNCDSSKDSKCGEKFESHDRFKIDCAQVSPQHTLSFSSFLPRNATGCMKRLFDAQPGHPRIERTCFFGDVSHTQAGCVPEINQFARVLSCDVCTGNLCNGSSVMAPLGVAIAIFFALARIFS